MRHISGKITCDKVTLGKVFSNTRSRGLETVCNRKAKYARMSAGGIELHFCERHRSIAFNPTIENFKPAPMSKVKLLNPS